MKKETWQSIQDRGHTIVMGNIRAGKSILLRQILRKDLLLAQGERRPTTIEDTPAINPKEKLQK